MVYDLIVLSGALKGSFNLRDIKRLLALRGGKKVGQELRLRPPAFKYSGICYLITLGFIVMIYGIFLEMY